MRNLEREIGAILHHIAMRVAEGDTSHMRIAPEDLHDILGARKFENEVAMRTSVPGVATGLAWTPVGGDILFIECARVPGNGKLILTGQLGDVMKESASAALTFIRSRAKMLGIEPPGPDRAKKTSICTCRPAPSPRTVRPRASPCSSRSPRFSPVAP